MCFKPKIKTPDTNANQIKGIEPAPLTEEPKGVLFGGQGDDEDEGTETEGRKGLKVTKDTSEKKVSKPKTGAAAVKRTAFGG